MSQKITKKKREKGPKYHRWNPSKQIYEIRKPYQLDHSKDKPNTRLVPLGMKQILEARGIWQTYLNYFAEKGLEFELYDDIGETSPQVVAPVVAEEVVLPPTKPNVTRKRKFKIVEKIIRPSQAPVPAPKPKFPTLNIPKPTDIPVVITPPPKIEEKEKEKETTPTPELATEPEPERDLSTPSPDDIPVVIKPLPPEPEPEPIEETPKAKSIIQTITDSVSDTIKNITSPKSKKPTEEEKEEKKEPDVEEKEEEVKEEEVKEETETEKEKEETPEEYIEESVVDAPAEPTDEITTASAEPLEQKPTIPILDTIVKTDTSEQDLLYPTLDDPNFQVKLSKHKEFNDTKYDGKIYDFREQADVLCNASFELMPHQIFIKNFLSNQTPYNSLLMYHGLGTGKTCSAIGVAEEARAAMKQAGITKSIFIIASPNVQDNFRLQLFDETKLRYENGMWNIRSCVGEALLNETNPTYFKNMSKERVINQVKAIINEHYVFMGYTQFANYISDSIEPRGIGYSKDEKARIKVKKIRTMFNNRLIIIDEVHNIRITHENKNKKTAELLMQVARYANNMRMLLLSATPMYNSHEEIIWLTNLMNLNDKRAPIKISDVFDKKGDFVKVGGKRTENGRDLLIRKLTGYVSYVRGENPYSFPFRIYPEDTGFREPDRPYPKLQMNGNPIDPKKTLKHIPIVLNPIGEFQREAYDFVVRHVFQIPGNQPTIVAAPEQSPPPSEESTPESESSQESTPESESSEESSLETESSQESSSESTPSGELSTSEPQPKKGGAESPDDTEIAIKMDTYRYTQLQRPLEALNITYPTQRDKIAQPNLTQEERELVISKMVGSEGLESIMTYKEHTKDYQLKYNYEYKTTEYGRIFAPTEIGKYSSKISNICSAIKNSEGIVLVYSQWIDGGIIPMALALEEMGFTRYGTEKYTRPLFKTPPTEPIDSLTMKPKSEFSRGGGKGGDGEGDSATRPFRQAKYLIITGESAFSPNNIEDIKYLNNPKNKSGEFVKVVLISKAAAEGIDFKNIRQIHVMEPWFNMNRVEQIIGRGVRNLSHCGLPFEKRNVEIFLHATQLPTSTESTDLYIYRLAEQKAIKIGNVTRILKETAVDCILNIAQTNYTAEKIAQLTQNTKVEIETSSGRTIEYTVGDKPYTDICDYKDNCNFKCSPGLPDGQTEIPEAEILRSTYNEVFLQANRDRIIKRIRELFKDIPGQHMGRVFYHIDELIPAINIVKEYPIEQIYSSLTYLIDNKNEYLIDRYGRKGNLINHGEYYIFQPIEITDEHASIYERSRPVDFKHTSIMVELPSKDAAAEQPLLEEEPGEPVEEGKDAAVEKPTTSTKFEEIYEQFKENYRQAFATKKSKVLMGERSWYKNLTVVLQHLQDKHGIPRETIEKYTVDHMIDEISVQEKLVLLNTIYNKSRSWKPIEAFDMYLKEYFDDRMVVAERSGLIGITFTPDNKTPTVYVQGSTGAWVPAEFTDASAIIRSPQYSQKLVFNKAQLNQIIGFMSWVESQNEYVFKIRDITDSVNKRGARVAQATAKDIITRINSVLGEQYYTVENVKEFFGEGKNRLVVIVELLMRHYQENQRDGKIWFLSNEQVFINGILNWTRK